MCMFMYVLLHVDINPFYNIKPEIVKSGDDHVIYLPVSCDDRGTPCDGTWCEQERGD